MRCESCNSKDVEIDEPAAHGYAPYHLCWDCHRRLLNRSLRPSEFFNLATIHGHDALLHDDLYDDNGKAEQPNEKVIDADKFPFPELDNIKDNVYKLIDYSCVEYFTSDKTVELLKAHDKAVILNYLIHKVNYNRAINYKAYEIAAKVLGGSASEWIRYEWGDRKKNELWIFAEAVCACLEFDEAFNMLTGELELLDEKKLADNVGTLAYLQNPKVLDWMEMTSKTIVNVSDNWGVLAAFSKFSWQRAEKWLTIGRPLSLIALDVLIYCTSKGEGANQPYQFRKSPPILVEPPTASAIIDRLDEYLSTDNKPRTRMAIEEIKKNLVQ